MCFVYQTKPRTLLILFPSSLHLSSISYSLLLHVCGFTATQWCGGCPRDAFNRITGSCLVSGTFRAGQSFKAGSHMCVLHVDFRRTSPPMPAGPTVTGTLTRRTRSKPTRACARPTGKCGTDLASTGGIPCQRGTHTQINLFQRAASLWIVLWTQGRAIKVKPRTHILQNCRIPEWFELKETF